MITPEGYTATSWESAYGGYIMKPHLSTLRRLPWLDGAALVLCDVLDHNRQPDRHACPCNLSQSRHDNQDGPDRVYEG